MARFEKQFNNPYPNGWSNLPSEETPITAEALQQHTDSAERVEDYLANDLQEELDEIVDYVPEFLSDLKEDSEHRTVTDQEKERWNQGGGGGGSVVVVTPTLTSGTKIADISVNGENKELYAPQGGGTSTDVELTKEQYDAIGDEKLTNGINYFIKDWSQGSSGGTKFSKKILFDGILNATSFTEITIPSIEEYDAILLYGSYCSGLTWECINPPLLIFKEDYLKVATVSGETDYSFNLVAGTSSYRNVFFRFKNYTTLYYKSNNSNACIKQIVGLKFGSSGGSTKIKYSTEEQVIGEWIDGRNVYEKTLVMDTYLSINASTWSNTGITIENIDFLLGDSKYIGWQGDGTNFSIRPCYTKQENGTIYVIGLHTGRLKYITIRYVKVGD